MQKSWIASVLALAFSLPIAPANAAINDTAPYQWNLSDLYADRALWDKDAAFMTEQMRQLGRCSQHLGTTVGEFKTCLDLYADISKRYARLQSYASQYRDQDTATNAGQDVAQTADLLGSQFEQASAFLRPELLQLGEKKIAAFLKQERSLGMYRFMLEDIARGRSHTLDAKGEQLIADFGLATNAAAAVFTTLSNADMPWPKVKLSNGTEIVIDQAAYTKYRAAPVRADRKLVFDAFWGKWQEFERTYGVTFYEQLKKDSAYAKVRNYPDSLSAALDADNIPRAVYDTLIAQTQANLPTLHRYFKLRGKMLGVADLHYYDMYPALVSGDYHYAVEEGVQLMLASVKPLGDEYVKAMSAASTARWMDVYPRPHKRSGAYMNGAAYDVHPYLLLNYNDDYESVSTLAHEWGHAMHSYLANRNQAFITSGYPTFTAEIASTTNEVFLLEHMLSIANSDDERLLYLGSALENLRGTFFRQAMFADFEREVHARVDRGESLTGEALSKIYGDILKRYHGDAEGVMKIDPVYASEWAYIPHFYTRFYVFQYATSIAAGSAFAAEILQGKPGARDNYLAILKAGGAEHPYQLVKRAGVDLATPAPYLAVFKRMNSIMDQIEAILAKR
ncbi:MULTISPECIES: oligoendopeptidase F [unclassified Undibacterium]|uniref:oligoendopeptidase F n=1 Tax=unclassified Undibacterium TaxID=2630295 RepID=UPI002AC9E90C|nr:MULTISPECIES: oligoendopeptidase F [unclassified Undibacterium]MEB0140141.1 oligoendopeptidase F [Undibacterium sp. CCC2.1]MEB0173591.1 oligoendopeptidase F [Undibacterium sp. CCC1.1]MEB0177553.1 oligoendopeptidase F [Undibacterium sp. CCC3.4]MEB0214444.1 oligoendopeptidase F [Undibacterium sp. 5I2]WPX42841.1 oligoendopeptidase F [Undibacterium sp. CCC3.4]